MAALMCSRLWTASFKSNYSFICASLSNIVIKDGLLSTSFNGSLANEAQKRHMTVRRKRRSTHDPRIWPVRRAKFIQEHLTEENTEFLDDVIKEKHALSANSPLKDSPWARGEWTPKSRRTGLVARKIGIYPMWLTNGTRVLTTLLQVQDNHVIRYVPPEIFVTTKYGFGSKSGKYGALMVGAEPGDPRTFTHGYNNLFKEAGVMPKKKLTRFYITPDAAIQPGTPLSINHFRVGDYVDVYGKTVDHGFQGVMKRWGMKGGPATHGTTKAHRRVGTIGTGRTMARVWRGKKMPGHMGSERRTLLGLKILRINTTYNCMWVLGPAVPGAVHSFVYIMDTRLPTRKCLPENLPPFPTFYAGEQEPLPEEICIPEVHQFSSPSINFENEPEIAIPTVGAKKTGKAKR